jgi:hypothetical protein
MNLRSISKPMISPHDRWRIAQRSRRMKSRLKRERVLARGSAKTGSPMRRGRFLQYRRCPCKIRRSSCLVARERELETQQHCQEASGRSSQQWLQYPLDPVASTRRSALASPGRCAPGNRRCHGHWRRGHDRGLTLELSLLAFCKYRVIDRPANMERER